MGALIHGGQISGVLDIFLFAVAEYFEGRLAPSLGRRSGPAEVAPIGRRGESPGRPT